MNIQTRRSASTIYRNESCVKGGEDSFLRCVVLLLALGVHSLFEGVAIGLQDDLWTLVSLAIGVGLHGVLMAFALGVSLARQGLSRSTLYKLSVAFR